jgi:eukaryotic-like serine/threonine-protein kinase
MSTRFPRALQRHILSEPIGAGGMASVHVAVSPETPHVLALKRVHRHLACAAYTQMLLEEARVASCVRHENVVRTHGADMIGDEVFLVMDYVPGLPLHVVMRKLAPVALPVRFAVAIVADVLRGLHAAHEAVDASGHSLGLIHRDISPQNILLGSDGVARVLDFGIARADGRTRDTCAGELKGKLSYMAPEQLRGDAVDRRADIYAAAVVLWETLVGLPLFCAKDDGGTYQKALQGCTTRPCKLVAGVSAALDAVVMRGLAVRPQDRFATALDMASALDSVLASTPVARHELAAWLRTLGAEALRKQERVSADLRRHTSPPPPPPPPHCTVAPPVLTLFPTALHEGIAILAAVFVAANAFGFLLAFSLSNAMGVR